MRRAASGLTLFEVLVAVALLGALLAITLPLVTRQSERLTFDEVLTQIERQAAVVRSDAQRQSELVWFEARLDPDERIWSLGVVHRTGDAGTGEIQVDELAQTLQEDLREPDERAPSDSMQPDSMAGDLRGAESFETRMNLPRGYRVLSSLPEEVKALVEGTTNQGFGDDGDIASALTGSPMEELADQTDVPDSMFDSERVLVAVFLPDGTLVGPDEVYLQAPGDRYGSIETSRWLGVVRCRELTIQDLVQDDQEKRDDESRIEKSDTESTSQEPEALQEVTPDGEGAGS